MRVLVADDDPAFRRLVAGFLDANGVAVEVAVDGMQATMLVQRSPPDAVVLDISMPGGTGLDVIKRLRGSFKTSLVPIVAVSALEDPELPQHVMELGANAFVPKPVDLEELLRVIQRIGRRSTSTPVEKQDR